MTSRVNSLFRSRWLTLCMAALFTMTAGTTPVMTAEQQVKPQPRQAKTAQVARLVGDPAGSIFLKGDFIEVGMHTLGSFGAEDRVRFSDGFHPLEDVTTDVEGAPLDGMLGFIVNPNGWKLPTDKPTDAGDFFVPGTPEEVWGVTWDYGADYEHTVRFMNAGLVDGGIAEAGLARAVDFPVQIPNERGFPTDISSGTDRRSVWRGTAEHSAIIDDRVVSEALTITQTTHFDVKNMYFVINVVMTNNSADTTIHNLRYLRSVDPDQESGDPLFPTFDTLNYVVYQPPHEGQPGIPSGNKDKALVVGKGINKGTALGLGTIDPRAAVAYGGFTNRDPLGVLRAAASAEPVVDEDDNDLDDAARVGSPVQDDFAISLAFELGNLGPKQSVSIDYAYVLSADALEEALGELSLITILQPTGTVSGNAALFQVSTQNPASPTVQVDFFVAGYQVGTDTDASGTGTYEVVFNTLTLDDGSPLPNGPVTIEAVATFADQTTSRKSASVTVDNAGPPVTFSGATPANGATVIGSVIPIEVSGLDAENPPFQVTIFREVQGVSIVLATDNQSPFVTTMDVTDLPDGTIVVFKAVASNQDGSANTTIARSVISATFPPGEDTVVTAPTLPLSQGDQTIYVAVSPSTPQGRTSLLAMLTGSDNTVTRAFTWDPIIASYVERPSSPTGGVQVSTGIFIATRVPLSYSLDGTSVQGPFTLTLPANGWVFAGVPPIDTGDGVLTEHSWSDTQVWLDGEVQLDGSSTPTIAEAMGNPATPADSSSAHPYFWNGTAYEQVETLDTGKAYWFKNNLSEPLTLVFGDLDVAVAAAKAAAKAAKGLKVSRTPVQIRNQGTPPPPPSGKSKASSSSGGGCGVGSGIASLAFVMLMLGFRFLVVRR